MRNYSGFTFLELMTVIGILTLLAAIGLPNFISWRDNAQLGRAARELYSSFHLAKVSAVRTNQFCTVAFSQGGYDFVVFVDDDSDLVLDNGEQRIAFMSWADYGTVSLSSVDFSGNPGNAVGFAPDGLPRNNSGNLSSGSINLNNRKGRTVSLNLTLAGGVAIQ